MSRTKQVSAIRNLLSESVVPESLLGGEASLRVKEPGSKFEKTFEKVELEVSTKDGQASVRERASELGPEALAELYRENESLVRAVIFQIAGEQALDDLVQEAFIKIWKGWAEFRGDAKVSSWIYRVSVNVALDHARREARTRENQLSESVREAQDAGLSSDSGPEVGLANRELVSKGLMSLSEEHRAVLVLSFLHDLPLLEVANLLEVAEGTVKSRLHFAKAQFRQFLEKKGVKI